MTDINLNRIKIWSLGDDFSSALIPYDTKRVNLKNPVYIDFENVKKISSSGVTIITSKLIKLISKYPSTTWIPYFGKNESQNYMVKDFLSTIGVMQIFDEEIKNKDLFFSNETEIRDFDNPKLPQKSLPIYRIRNSDCHDRNNVEDLIFWIDNNLGTLLSETNFRIEVFARMIREMAKNSYDHTKNDAFLGIDIYRRANNSSCLKFALFDLGEGIHKNIKKYCKSIGEKDTDKYGLSTTYYKAFSKGLSSGKNKHNRGIGMSIIHECSSVLDFDLCIFDANSMAVVPPTITSNSIRDSFCDTKRQVGFGYYGEILIKHN